jgi:uncharacterized protein DUF5412
VTAALLIAGVVGLGVLVYLAVDSMCGNETLAEVASPDGTKKVVVFERNCGATSRYGTHASLLEPGAKLNNSGNVFVAYSGPPLRVRWDSPSRLVIQHHADVQVFKREALHRGVEIHYATFK